MGVGVGLGGPMGGGGGGVGGARGGVLRVALGADRDFTIVADADAGLLTPDVRPPRAVGGGAILARGPAAVGCGSGPGAEHLPLALDR